MIFKRKMLAILLGGILGLNAVTSPAVTNALDPNTLARAWESQSVLLYYSFCSVLPLKIINQLFTDGTAMPAASPQRSDPSKQQDHRSVDEVGIVSGFKTLNKVVKRVTPVGGGFTFVPVRFVVAPSVASGRVSVLNDFIVLLMLLLLAFLPRSGIEDTGINIRKKIG